MWWPQSITRADLTTGRPAQTQPGRPSWCYGTPGIARAHHVAAQATGDTALQVLAEQALTACVTDPAQLDQVSDGSLCHGWAGLCQTVWRTANDSTSPALAAVIPELTDRLITHTQAGWPDDSGLLTGTAGLALALHTAATQTPPISGWDVCLLLT